MLFMFHALIIRPMFDVEELEMRDKLSGFLLRMRFLCVDTVLKSFELVKQLQNCILFMHVFDSNNRSNDEPIQAEPIVLYQDDFTMSSTHILHCIPLLLFMHCAKVCITLIPPLLYAFSYNCICQFISNCPIIHANSFFICHVKL